MNEDTTSLERRLQELRDRDEESMERVDLLLALAERFTRTDLEQMRACAEEAQALSERLGYTLGIGYGLGYKGLYLYRMSEHKQARGYLQQAVSIFEQEGEAVGLSLALTALAGIELSLGNYEPALTYGLRTLKLSREAGLQEQEAWLLNGIGVAYTETGNTERALAYFEQGIALFRELDIDIGIARTTTGIGTVLQLRGRYQEARSHHEESLAMYRAANDAIGESRALNDLGTVAFEQGDLERALAYHRQSLELREAQKNRQSLATSLMNIGRVYVRLGQFEQAFEVLERALGYAVEMDSLSKIYMAHEVLSEAYEARGDLAPALAHFQAFHRIKEAANGEEALSRFNRLVTEHEMEKSEREAELTRKRNAELRAKNEQLESLLQDLRTTQAQLVQAEKMASLGRLTAGIAHEIKNPLNFVNNFAKLSMGLLADLEEELADTSGGDPGCAEILADLRFNAEKIQAHGQRADGIVKSMMRHARGKKGDRQPTDLNALLDESINLAYHGMRAQVPAFNTTLERDFDAAVGTLEVVPQELSRVFLNVLGNAFYAVLEKNETGTGAYTPTVWVRTRRTGAEIAVSIRDNGPGIPEALLAKIFEPFFTTKPTGAGTGLGLSLSFDVVVQGHGGTMKVESVEGEGATFFITLPVGGET